MDEQDRLKVVAEFAAVLSTINNYQDVQTVVDSQGTGVVATWTGGWSEGQRVRFDLSLPGSNMLPQAMAS